MMMMKAAAVGSSSKDPSKSFDAKSSAIITPVRSISYQEALDSSDWMTKPALIKGFQPPSCSLETLHSLLRGTKIALFKKSSPDDRIELDAEVYLKSWEADEKLYNVVDHYLDDPRFDQSLPIPEIFLRYSTIVRDPRTEQMRRSLVMSSSGTYTPFHIDSYGFGGWMYLHAGQKVWELIDGSLSNAVYDIGNKRIFDPVTYDPREKNFACASVFENLPRQQVVHNAGEIMYFPPGWVHRVYTPEKSFGYGGSSLTSQGVIDAVLTWKVEKALDIESGWLDFKDHLDLVFKKEPGLFPKPQDNILPALDMCSQTLACCNKAQVSAPV